MKKKKKKVGAVIALPNSNEKLKLLGHLAQREIGKLTKWGDKIFMARIVKEKVNNLRRTVRWENSVTQKTKKEPHKISVCLRLRFLSCSITVSQGEGRMVAPVSSLCHVNSFFASHMFLSGSVYAAILPWSVRFSVLHVFPYPTCSWIKNFDLPWLSFFIWNFIFQAGLYFMKQSTLSLACCWPFAFGEMTVKMSLARLH